VTGPAASATGFTAVPREQWLKAWAVGDHHSGEVFEQEVIQPDLAGDRRRQDRLIPISGACSA
jgi:hypothetical protein